jgi:hypothetical protein
MATYLAGHGGAFVVGTGAGTEVGIFTWTLNKDPRLAETTNSGTGGSTRYKRTVKDNSWTIELPVDSDQILETVLSLDSGSELAQVKFQLGESALAYTLTNTTVETMVPVVNNQNDIVRMTITGKGGALTGPA